MSTSAPAPAPQSQSSQVTNAPAIPTIPLDEGPKVKPPTVPLEQRLAKLRDDLKSRYPKSSVTCRLDITSAEPMVEFVIYVSEFKHGLLGKYQTIFETEAAVAQACLPDAKFV